MSGSQTRTAGQPRGYVLVVDDEPGMTDIVATNLRAEGYEVTSASDGAAAVSAAQRRRPDLIVLDIMLPKLDGWQVLQTLEGRPDTAGIPVILLTAKTDDADVLRGLDLGAVEYITKPFFPEDLVASVKIQLEVLDPIMRDRHRADLMEARRRLMQRRARG